MLPGSKPCDGLIARPEETYRVQCVKLCVTEEQQQQEGFSLGPLGLLSHDKN